MVQELAQFQLALLEFARAPQDAYGLHQELWRAFPGFGEGTRPFLFRADRVLSEGRPRLKVLVQSTAPGEWQRIKERVARVESRECALSVVRGESFRFLLRANPTVRRKGRDEPAFREIGGEAFRSRAGRRVALLRDDDRLDWLDRKAASAGFSIARDRVRLQNTRVWRWHRGDEMARHDGVDFEGILTVTNPASFVAALNSGIGTARAFGFGMLSVARLPR